MKSKKVKKFLCLLMVLALLSGLLAGCQSLPTTSSTQNDSELKNTTYTTGGSCFPVETHPKIDDPWSNVHGYSTTPNDIYYELEHHWALSLINLPDSWDLTTGSATIRVGVIDSGIDISHPDLVNRVNTELSESFIPGVSPL